MLVRFSKGLVAANADALVCVRPDGSRSEAEMPRQGILPHLAFHFAVEATLGWRDALLGRVAAGHSLAELHGKRGRAGVVRRDETQALQSEALIECLEAEQWGGAADPAEFAQRLLRACRHYGVPPPDITAEELDRVRMVLRELGAAWRPLPAGTTLERTF